ncbi:2-oxo-4-hydroxy-4-carboxy-5-ureidoimidazoline decarboxylase [Actinomadura rugatobispora]|uniref:2-oxo-4-hydroxy-4-carboxy-5-ureidoimidazoline decarboxylase n=1 Tax=Actinomadura rugatobispora TaxID=1994 RepID=A0ABW1A9V4_9ACTN|nr:2-oxo-4-hydroxy-4-carboxy-5-ureidoimidazoline decarboxylase [Actinomadura rugatobispora]
MVVTRDVLLGCLAIPRWADEVLAGHPYTNAAGVLAAAVRASGELTDEELVQALSGHPRIGEHGGAQSRLEQSGIDLAVDGTAARLASGNAAYEERFSRVFIIRAAGRDGEEILAELERRLHNDDATERAETIENLRQIALLRLEAALS